MREAVAAALARHRLGEAEVAVSLVGDEEIRELNRRHRGVDAVTDVLAFPLYEPAELHLLRGRARAGQGPDAPLLLGDVVISLPQAERQAVAFGHPLARELAFLAVHGALHLLGYDHATPEEERVMSGEVEAILGDLGLSR